MSSRPSSRISSITDAEQRRPIRVTVVAAICLSWLSVAFATALASSYEIPKISLAISRSRNAIRFTKSQYAASNSSSERLMAMAGSYLSPRILMMLHSEVLSLNDKQTPDASSLSCAGVADASLPIVLMLSENWLAAISGCDCESVLSRFQSV